MLVKQIGFFVLERRQHSKRYGNLTDEIRYQASVGESSRREPEKGLSIRPEVCLIKSCGVDVVVVAGVQERVPEDE